MPPPTRPLPPACPAPWPHQAASASGAHGWDTRPRAPRQPISNRSGIDRQPRRPMANCACTAPATRSVPRFPVPAPVPVLGPSQSQSRSQPQSQCQAGRDKFQHGHLLGVVSAGNAGPTRPNKQHNSLNTGTLPCPVCPATLRGCARFIHLATHRISPLLFISGNSSPCRATSAAFPKTNGGFQHGTLPKTALNQPINPAASTGDNEV